MGITGEDVKRQVSQRLNQNGLISKTTDEILNTYISTVCLEVAAMKWWEELLKTGYADTDSNGQVEIDELGVPYMVFINGTENETHSWERVTPIEYPYFERWKSGRYRGGYRSGAGGGHVGLGRRYTVIPSSDPDKTVIQLLELEQVVPIKVIYYPMTPSVADFSAIFLPLIVNKVLELWAIDNEQSSKDRFFAQLKERNKDLTRALKKLNTIEIVSGSETVRNRKTRDFMAANDIGVWKS